MVPLYILRSARGIRNVARGGQKGQHPSFCDNFELISISCFFRHVLSDLPHLFINLAFRPGTGVVYNILQVSNELFNVHERLVNTNTNNQSRDSTNLNILHLQTFHSSPGLKSFTLNNCLKYYQSNPTFSIGLDHLSREDLFSSGIVHSIKYSSMIYFTINTR